MHFNNYSNIPIGLDISDTSLKVVQFDKRGNKITLQALGRAHLESGSFKKGEIINFDKAVSTIKNLLKNPQYGKITSDEVVASLPESKTFLKLIKIEKSQNSFDNLLESEIEKYVPMQSSELYIDYQIVKASRDSDLVLFGASPKYIVDQYTNLLEKAGLKVVALEIEPIAICRSLLREENINIKQNYDKNYIIIDIGATRTSLTIYSKNTILFTISLSISGHEITEKIADMLKIDVEQAEKAKIICGLDENIAQGVVKSILNDVTLELIKKINEAREFYSNHFAEKGQINQIIICGGGAYIKNLNLIIKESTGIETITGNSLTNIQNLTDKFKKLSADIIFKKEDDHDHKNNAGLSFDVSSIFSTSIGLALRSIFLEE